MPEYGVLKKRDMLLLINKYNEFGARKLSEDEAYEVLPSLYEELRESKKNSSKRAEEALKLLLKEF